MHSSSKQCLKCVKVVKCVVTQSWFAEFVYVSKWFLVCAGRDGGGGWAGGGGRQSA